MAVDGQMLGGDAVTGQPTQTSLLDEDRHTRAPEGTLLGTQDGVRLELGREGEFEARLVGELGQTQFQVRDTGRTLHDRARIATGGRAVLGAKAVPGRSRSSVAARISPLRGSWRPSALQPAVRKMSRSSTRASREGAVSGFEERSASRI
ncbi:hypothetical protein [Streptomyces sp. Wb2n-11]|uniref:hypothetical protein n=1 Tax=Streptomyces sp. Wb2n-11 TaxID=1030533 RepID=UPI000A6D7E07|nr:hypothetical protein [Streptomyces sp. Wb2n-11]